MKTAFPNLPDNCTILFTESGITLRVSLNIPKGMKRYVSPNNLFRGEKKYWVYSIKIDIPSTHITLKNVLQAYDHLLAKGMYNVRGMKQQWIDDQRLQLAMKMKQTEIEF
jgi:hypothetical protein